ncbi:MAG: hypothetical protein R3185_00375 [Candidatus Thermoplasmatota archaeon]|nr:hypothetical protein [Candidatus Thermoplasmatota archaeon]
MRVPAGLMLLALTAILLLAGSGAAQTSCAVELSVADENPSTSGFRADEAGRVFRFDVTNTGNLDAEGTFSVLTSPPPGWFWDTQDQQVNVASGSTTQVSLTALYEGPQERPAELRVRITNVACSGPLAGAGVNGQPTDPVSLSFSAAPGASPADGGDTLWPWALFGVIVVGTAVAIPVYYRRGRANVEAFCEDPEREVVAGRGTSFPVVLRNKAGEAAHVSLDVADVKEGWSALTTLPDLELGPKESRTLYMMVRAPDTAKPGDLCVVKLHVTPEGGSAEVVETVARVVKPPAA